MAELSDLSIDYEFVSGVLRLKLMEKTSQGGILIDSIDIKLSELQEALGKNAHREHISRSRDRGEDHGRS